MCPKCVGFEGANAPISADLRPKAPESALIGLGMPLYVIASVTGGSFIYTDFFDTFRYDHAII